MNETALPPSPNTKLTDAAPSPLWQPVLMRSMVTLLFGIITVFWGTPDTVGLCLHFGWYFVAVALVQLWFLRRLALPRTGPRRVALLGAAAVLGVSGVVIFVAINTALAAWLGGAALALMGAAELFAALQGRGAGGKQTLRSDWLISGVLGLGTGVLLPVFTELGPHALLGVGGGGALMTGALWLLSALTLRHDARTPKGK